MLEEPSENCVIQSVQKKGTTFPVNIASRTMNICRNALMDTGAVRSCMNYDTYKELGDTTLNWKATPTVTRADGSDLGAMGKMKYMLIQVGHG